MLAVLQAQAAVLHDEIARANVCLQSERAGLELAVREATLFGMADPRVLAAKLRVVMAQSDVVAARTQALIVQEQLRDAEEDDAYE